MLLPNMIDKDLLEILGRPNFTCASIAQVMRYEGVDIPRKSEAEQAHVIFKLLSLYAKHGEGWRGAAGDWLLNVESRRQKLKQE